MSSAPFDSPAARVTLVLTGLMSSTGIIMVFLPQWLETERGLDGAAIGAVLAVAPLARIIVGPALAFWADSVAERRLPLQAASAATLAAFAAFFFLAHSFWSLIGLCFVAASLLQTITPLAEAATLRATATGKTSYGLVRGIGSAAFIVANIGGGQLVKQFGLEAFVAWTLASMTLLAWACQLLPSDPAPHADGAVGARAGLATLLRSRRYIVLILACGLIQSGHAFYYAFATIVWRGQGVAADTIGFLWAFGVAFEVAFLWSLGWIERRVTPEALILLAAGAGVVRWLSLGLAPSGWILWPLQALHGLSFAAAHVGAMRLIYREAPPSAAAMGQTLYSAIASGLIMGAATLASGKLYDAGGAHGYWAMAALAAAGGAVGLLLLAPRAKPATPH